MHSIYIKALTHHLPISFLLAFHLTFKLPYNRGQQKKSGRNSKATTIVPFPQLCFSRASQQAKPQSHLLHARAHLNEDELTTHTHTLCHSMSLGFSHSQPCSSFNKALFFLDCIYVFDSSLSNFKHL